MERIEKENNERKQARLNRAREKSCDNCTSRERERDSEEEEVGKREHERKGYLRKCDRVIISLQKAAENS